MVKDGVRVSCRGAASAEWLVVAPAVLAVGFGVLQWALLMHGRASVEYAAFQGARAGATSHADPDAIVSGMAVGLVGIRGEEITSVPVSASRAGATALLREELAIGIAAWRQARPTPDDFADWAVPALDEEGRALPGVVEIPNDNLRHRGSEVGARSGRSLLESNLLEIELVYAWPMRVPLIGGLAVRWMQWFDGCDGSPAPSAGYDPWGRADWRIAGGAWRCPFYRAGGVPRWPLRVVARARMHSAARHAGTGTGSVPGDASAGPLPAVAGGPSGQDDDSGAFGTDSAASPGAAGPGAAAGGAPAGDTDHREAGDPGGEPEAIDVADRPDISQPGECFAQAESIARGSPREDEREEVVVGFGAARELVGTARALVGTAHALAEQALDCRAGAG